MSLQDSKPDVQKTRWLPRARAGEPLILRTSIQNFILGAVQSFVNLRVFQPVSDGTNIIDVKEAEVRMTELGATVTMPAVGLPGAGGSGTGNMIWKGLWTAGTTAQIYEVWILQSGTATGTYISTANSNTNSPDTLTDWVQISTNRGQWQ